MIVILRTVIACLIIIVLVMQCFETKPFEISDKKFVYVNMQDGVGNYNFSYNDKVQLANRTEVGRIVESKLGKVVLVVNGSYANAFDRGDCQSIAVNYTADEKGFRVRFSYSEKVKNEKDENGMVVSACPAYRAAQEPKGISSNCIASLQGSCSVG